MNFSSAYLTDVGLKRTSNEDSVLGLMLSLDTHEESGTMGLFVVSDGMGGKERGELASKITVKTLGEAFLQTFMAAAMNRVAEVSNYGQPVEPENKESLASPARFLMNTIQAANHRIFHLKKGEERVKLGATVTAGILTDDLLTLGHVGDCRCYLFYENSLRQLTHDHSMVNEMIKKGILSPDEARNHPHRNILARALGSSAEVEVDTTVSVLSSGCKILLCTDGLYTMVPEEQIQATLSQAVHPTILAEELIRRANEAGGKDNITAMIVQIL